MRLPTPTLGLAGYAALAGLILGVLVTWRIMAWIHQGEELKAVRQSQASDRAIYAANLKTLQDQVQQKESASRGYQDELALLRAQPVPTRVVRLCHDAASSERVPKAPPAEPRPDATPPAPSVLPPELGPDIAGKLYGLIDRADELLAQCRGLQNFATR